ncbi:(E2-independent) E3 ubiquitin-conjugating enzyme FATS isoform X2 [Ctenopharyngodon idella]|uniref:(E2-independent) E3 ubiquitin-conjugating enzyme FATS isoform X2 n=1 Tax=Ctenopharyngodon idella TaxID=7959 RepID=UPI00222FC49B|nr:(E2-independent) E3 ubiquitin-conjugating enzyme FATS isoform X2 [Ctenopharyngodon idella]
MRSNLRLRGWKCSYQSTPNIHEAVDNEYSWHLHQNAMTPCRSLRSRWEDPVRGRRTPPFLSGFTSFDESWRSEHTPSPFLFLGRTRSVPEALHCFSRPTLRSSFSSISITARSLSPKRDCTPHSSSAFSPLNMPDRVPSFMARSENKIAGTPMLSKHKAVVVTVDESSEHHCANETPSSPQAPPGHRHSYTMEGEETDSSPPLKRHIFRSCVHLELLPSNLSRSTLYLDKSLSIPLRQTLYRSTLSLSLGKPSFTQNPEKPRTMIQPKMSYSDWDMANVGVDGTERPSQHLKDSSTINGSTFKNNAGSGSDTRCSTLTSLPFRTRCHSSSAAFRLNGKANDVLGPLQSNLRARQAFSKPSGVPQACERAPLEVRTVFHTAEKVRRLIECPVSPHLTNCTCGSRTDQQATKPQSLSLREALELFRPDFISRSQNRLRRIELRARERRSLQTAEFIMGVETANRRRNCTKPHPLSDNLFKPRDRAISGKEMQWRSRRIYNKLPEVARKKEEERKRLVSETNRLRAEVFKKKLLDQILQRHSD